MYRINKETGQLISLDEIRQHLNASIPEMADLSNFGYPFVVDDPYPEMTESQKATLGKPFNDQGTWRRSWTVTDQEVNYSGVSINRHQAKIVLMNHGLLDQVNSLMEQADPKMVIAWTEAPSFSRNSPTLLAMASALNLSKEHVDELFTEALSVVI